MPVMFAVYVPPVYVMLTCLCPTNVCNVNMFISQQYMSCWHVYVFSQSGQRNLSYIPFFFKIIGDMENCHRSIFDHFHLFMILQWTWPSGSFGKIRFCTAHPETQVWLSLRELELLKLCTKHITTEQKTGSFWMKPSKWCNCADTLRWHVIIS